MYNTKSIVTWIAALALCLGEGMYVAQAGVQEEESQRYIAVSEFKGYTAFTDEFNTESKHGKYLNITVENTSDTPVFISVDANAAPFIENYKLTGKSKKTIHIEDLIHNGLSSDFSIYIYNKNGKQYALNVTALQFQDRN